MNLHRLLQEREAAAIGVVDFRREMEAAFG